MSTQEFGIGVFDSSGSILDCEIHNYSFAGIFSSQSGQLNVVGNEIHDNGGIDMGLAWISE